MAIDPATAKVIAKVATKVATSKTGKKAIGGIIVGGIALLLIIIAIPIYILSHPLGFLGNLFGIGTPAHNAVEGFKTEYDYVVPANSETITKIGKYPLPLKGEVRTTSEYGERTDPITGEQSFHNGIDLSGSPHCHVISIADGTVVFAGISDNINIVKIKHTDEEGKVFYSRYLHLFAIFVKEGDTVTAEYVIGLEGGDPALDVGAGHSTGRHLHFELRDENDQPYNPYDALYMPPEEETPSESSAS